MSVSTRRAVMVVASLVIAARAAACIQDVAPLIPPNPVNFLFPNWK